MEKVVQDLQPGEPSESAVSSETINVEDGDNEFLNLAWLYNIEIPDDPQDLNPLPLPRPTHFTFRWQEIIDGTQNLLFYNLLGIGDFAKVYYCDFPRIDKVGAAKILNVMNAEAHTEFVAEIKTLHAANHPNVIKLLGKCVNLDDRVIVYEFMPKGSLDHHLYAETRPGGVLKQEYRVLDWDTRMRIAVGVADALIYVHEELKTIHRDVNVSNVLLDEYFEPKLTDFGLATRIVENEDGVEQQIKISPFEGTPGCIAPETEWFGLVSSKSDVYSYGVFLLTLFTGRKAFDEEKPVEERNLIDWLLPVLSRTYFMPLAVDVALANRYSCEGLIRIFEAVILCMDPHVNERPNMRDVKSMVLQAAVWEVPELAPVTRRWTMI